MSVLSIVAQALGVKNSIGLLTLDATLREVHDRSSMIPDEPIETGSYIQDHIVLAPRRLTMQGFITDTPINGTSFGVQYGYEFLNALWESQTPFTVVSGLEVYSNMAFENLSMPKTREGALRFTATMKELTFTTATTTTVSDNVSDTQSAGASVNAGTQTTTEVSTDDVESSGTSISGGTSTGSLLSQVF